MAVLSGSPLILFWWLNGSNQPCPANLHPLTHPPIQAAYQIISYLGHSSSTDPEIKINSRVAYGRLKSALKIFETCANGKRSEHLFDGAIFGGCADQLHNSPAQYNYWAISTCWHMFLILNLSDQLDEKESIPLRFTFLSFWWLSPQTWQDQLDPRRERKRMRGKRRRRGRRRRKRRTRGQLLICCCNLPLGRSWPKATGGSCWHIHTAIQISTVVAFCNQFWDLHFLTYLVHTWVLLSCTQFW